jgi:PhzF family phenazine biosynthesis protein
MTRYRFHLVNVFAEAILEGNALCVFEDARGLTDAQMQALALQFNLSETTFVLPSTTASARVRIFTPSFEMPFAGHPTLGTAHVVRGLPTLGMTGDALSLETLAGVIPVTADGDTWTLQARAPKTRPAEASRAQIAQMLGIEEHDVSERAMWVDTGSEQLIVPLASPEAVERCHPSPELLARHGSNARRDGLAYVWAGRGGDDVAARFFFLKSGSLVEDPGSGSACANLGGWLVTTGAPLPATRTVHQGAQTGRPCRLGLRVDGERRIFVTGRVVALGSGEVAL